jgi:hypothetical protein
MQHIRRFGLETTFREAWKKEFMQTAMQVRRCGAARLVVGCPETIE